MAEMFFRAVTQAVLLFGYDMWVLLVEMERTVYGAHTGFLKHIIGKQAWRDEDGTWVTSRA